LEVGGVVCWRLVEEVAWWSCCLEVSLRDVEEVEMEGVLRTGGGGGLPPSDLRREPVRDPGDIGKC